MQAGAKAPTTPHNVSSGKINTNIKVIPKPQPNNIKSNSLKSPNINIDFLEFAGIKKFPIYSFISFIKKQIYYLLGDGLAPPVPGVPSLGSTIPPLSLKNETAASFSASDL